MLEIDGTFYPFDNKIVRRNLGNPKKDYPAVKKHIRNWRVAIDGGAYVGLWSKAMGEDFKTVYAFELSPQNYECLAWNAPEAIAFNAALGDIEGKCSLEPDAHEDSPVFRVVEGTDIRQTTIDGLNLKVCDFIKLDLQGYDHFALLGARETLKRCRPVVMFEHEGKCFSRYGVQPEDPDLFLESLGYRRAVAGHNPIYEPG